jgi:hypothetical protein
LLCDRWGYDDVVYDDLVCHDLVYNDLAYNDLVCHYLAFTSPGQPAILIVSDIAPTGGTSLREFA